MKALFRVANNYDQPNNDLVQIFKDTPSLEELAKAVNMKFPVDEDADTLAIVKLWQGDKVRLNGYFDCRLEDIDFSKNYW
jgi:hypothetical protein